MLDNDENFSVNRDHCSVGRGVRRIAQRGTTSVGSRLKGRLCVAKGQKGKGAVPSVASEVTPESALQEPP